MSLHRLLVPIALAYSCQVSVVMAADNPGGEPHAIPSAASTVAPSPAASTTPWRARLPASKNLIDRDDALVWQVEKGPGFTVVGVDERSGDPLIATSLGRLSVARALLTDAHVEALAVLPQLLQQATAAKLTTDGLSLTHGIMTGYHLRSAEVVVLPEGVLTKTPITPRDVVGEKLRITSAIAKLHDNFAAGQLNGLARTSIDSVLALLTRDDDHKQGEDTDPSFARRVVRCGWLSGLVSPAADETALEDAVRSAEEFQPVMRFANAECQLAQMHDAFGHGGWILTTPKRSACVILHDRMQYHFRVPDLHLVIELPAGSDPLTAAERATAAGLYAGTRRLAQWSASGGFNADLAAWRAVAPERGRNLDAHVASGFAPPHLTISAMNGDIVRLITAHGALSPPRDGSPAEAKRFLDDAAKALPDAAHLDLIGEHLFTYVHDSPDPAHPFLIGNKGNLGDIHQTSQQTVATITGGMFRGDCDDLAELYDDLALRQGRLPHIIDLPAHAADAWAEKQADGAWHTFVIHTGEPLEFSAPDLPTSLSQAYLHFDSKRAMNPDQVALELRFAGENTRSHWQLGYRIFSDPNYSATMIDVQRDWYFHTFHRGIAVMQRLIDHGDQDRANYQELSGLHRRIGQFERAIAYKREVIARTSDPRAKLEDNLLTVNLLNNAERFDEATTLARTLIEHDLPALAKELGDRLPRFGARFCAILDKDHQLDLQQQVLATFVYPTVSGETPSVRKWVESAFDLDTWNRDRWLSDYRWLSSDLIGEALGIVRERGPAHLADDPRLREWSGFSEEWLRDLAFIPQDDRSTVLSAYASQAFLDETLLGRERFRELVLQADFPNDPAYDHRRRQLGAAQLRLDLPWIRCSVPYWSFAIAWDLNAQKNGPFDATLITRHLAPLEAAYEHCRVLGLDSATIEAEMRDNRLICALLLRDRERLRGLLHAVRALDDRASYEATANTIGRMAKHLPLDWFDQVLDCWKSEVDYKPFYFAIAWGAAVVKADAQALAAAKLASERFADDPAFVEEYALMRQELAERKAAERVERVEGKAAPTR